MRHDTVVMMAPASDGVVRGDGVVVKPVAKRLERSPPNAQYGYRVLCRKPWIGAGWIQSAFGESGAFAKGQGQEEGRMGMVNTDGAAAVSFVERTWDGKSCTQSLCPWLRVSADDFRPLQETSRTAITVVSQHPKFSVGAWQTNSLQQTQRRIHPIDKEISKRLKSELNASTLTPFIPERNGRRYDGH